MQKLREECGVFGIYAKDNREVATTAYYGLFALQHRGQESCGIAVNDQGVISCYKDMGLVTETFNDKILRELKGQIAVGHVRYSTAGASVRENSQPLVMRYIKGTLAIAHNGNLSNAYELRHELEHRGCIFQTTIDSEVIAYLIARERVKAPSIEEAVYRANLEDLGRIASLCADRGIPLAVVFHPTYSQLPSQVREAIRADVADLDAHIRFFDWSEEVEAAGLEPSLHFYDPGHLNRAGAALFSAWLGDFLTGEMGLVPRPQTGENAAAWAETVRFWQEGGPAVTE